MRQLQISLQIFGTLSAVSTEFSVSRVYAMTLFSLDDAPKLKNEGICDWQFQQIQASMSKKGDILTQSNFE